LSGHLIGSGAATAATATATAGDESQSAGCAEQTGSRRITDGAIQVHWYSP
jgi:hypothetical protein